MAESSPDSCQQPSDLSPDSPEKNVSTIKTRGPRRRTKTGCLTCRQRRIKCGEEKPICNNCVKSRRECQGYGQRVIFRQPVGPIPHLGPITPLPNVPGSMTTAFITHQSTYAGFHDDGTGGRHAYLPLAPRPQAYHEQGHISMGSHPSLIPGHFGTVNTSMASAHYPVAPQVAEAADFPGKTEFPILPNAVQPNGNVLDVPYYMSAQFQSHQAAVFHGLEYPPSTQQHGALPLVSPGSQNPFAAPPHGHIHPGDVLIPDPYDVDEDDDLFDVETEDEVEYEHEFEPDAGLPKKQWAVAVPTGQSIPGAQPFATYISYNNLLASYRPSPFTSPLLDPETAQIFSHFITSVGPAMSAYERYSATESLFNSVSHTVSEGRSLWTYTLPMLALDHPPLLHAILAISSFHLARMTGQNPTASFRHYHYSLRQVRKAVSLPHRRQQLGSLAATLLLGFYEVMSAEHSKWNSHLAGGSYLIQETNFAAMTKTVREMRARANAAHMHEHGFMPEHGISPDAQALANDIFGKTESDVQEGLISVLMGRPVSYDDFRHVSGGLRDYIPGRVLTERELHEFRIRCDLYWWFCKQDVVQSIIGGNHLLMPYHRWGQCAPRAGMGNLDAMYGTFDHLILLLARIADFTAKDRKRKLDVMASNGGAWRPPPGLFPPGQGPNMGGPPPGGPSAPGQPPPSPPGPPPGHPSGPPGEPPSGHPGGPPSGPPPGSQNGPPGDSKRQPSPPMYGMAPAAPVHLPPGFAQTPSQQPPPSPSDSNSGDGKADLDARTAAAEADWHDIKLACEEFEKALGPGFQPLPPGAAPPISTPFGPAIQYRTQSAGLIWAFFYGARILLQRAHPSMPPAAMMAAGVATRQTAQDAQLVARIVGGIYSPQMNGQAAPLVDTNPVFCSVLVDTMIPLFFAGVQFTDPAQRQWVIAFLGDITRLTGQKSSAAVAYGCETAWIRAYEAGRGPPYQRTPSPEYMERRYGIVSIAGSERRFVMVSQGESLDMAMGLLSVEGMYPSQRKERVTEEI